VFLNFDKVKKSALKGRKFHMYINMSLQIAHGLSQSRTLGSEGRARVFARRMRCGSAGKDALGRTGGHK